MVRDGFVFEMQPLKNKEKKRDAAGLVSDACPFCRRTVEGWLSHLGSGSHAPIEPELGHEPSGWGRRPMRLLSEVLERCGL